MNASDVTLGFAFLAGLASFLSPCVFSLVPAYIGYLGGRSAGSARVGQYNRWITFTHGLAFVLGFSVIFILLGLGASALGSLMLDLRPWLTKIGGIVVIIFGLHMTGIIRIPFLAYDLRKQEVPDPKLGYLSSALLGIFFSFGWSPCIGPVLGAIYTLSFIGGSILQGMKLLSAYSIGLAIPFLVAAIEISLMTKVIRRYSKVMHYVEVVMGVVLIAVGGLLFMGMFNTLGSFGGFFGIFDELIVGRYILIGLISLMILGLIPAAIAHKKGRSFMDWWLFGVGLFVVALPAAILIKSSIADSEAP